MSGGRKRLVRPGKLVLVEASHVDEDTIDYELWTPGGLLRGRLILCVSWPSGGGEDGLVEFGGGGAAMLSDLLASLALIDRKRRIDVEDETAARDAASDGGPDEV